MNATSTQRELFTWDDVLPRETPNIDREGWEQWFPGGLSMFGRRLLLPPPEMQNGEPAWVEFPEQTVGRERRLEIHRRQVVSHLPSRYQSFFAWGDIDTARAFLARAVSDGLIDANRAQILEVSPNSNLVHRGDMSLLTDDPPDEAIRMYWNGEPGQVVNPEWEYVLRLPVTVLRVVGQRG